MFAREKLTICCNPQQLTRRRATQNQLGTIVDQRLSFSRVVITRIMRQGLVGSSYSINYVESLKMAEITTRFGMTTFDRILYCNVNLIYSCNIGTNYKTENYFQSGKYFKISLYFHGNYTKLKIKNHSAVDNSISFLLFPLLFHQIWIYLEML